MKRYLEKVLRPWAALKAMGAFYLMYEGINHLAMKFFWNYGPEAADKVYWVAAFAIAAMLLVEVINKVNLREVMEIFFGWEPEYEEEGLDPVEEKLVLNGMEAALAA